MAHGAAAIAAALLAAVLLSCFYRVQLRIPSLFSRFLHDEIWPWIRSKLKPKFEFLKLKFSADDFLPLPLFGGIIYHIWILHRFHDGITDTCRRCAKTFRAPHLNVAYIHTSDPAVIEHVLRTNFSNYVKGQFINDILDEFLGHGILNVDGAEWKQQRRTASYEFSTRSLKDLCESEFRIRAEYLARYLLAHAKENRGPLDMQDVLLRLTFDSFSKIGFGLEMRTLQRNPPPEQMSFQEAFDECNAVTFWRSLDPLWKWKRWFGVGSEAVFRKHINTLNSTVYSLIEKRKTELHNYYHDLDNHDNVKLNLLSRFLKQQQENPPDEQLADKKIRDIVMNFFLAGRDTTALTLSWFLYAISQNPSVRHKLMQELCEVYGPRKAQYDQGRGMEDEIEDFSHLQSYDNLSKLQYMQACLQETLRLFPALPNDLRVAVAPDVLPGGMKVKKDDGISIAIYSAGRMEWLWGEDAAEFKPKRFMDEHGLCQQVSPFKLPALLAGPRMCLGKDFAYLQMKVTATFLLRFFTFEIAADHVVQYKPMITLHMSDGLQMLIHPICT